jgi:hypothetical protein
MVSTKKDPKDATKPKKEKKRESKAADKAKAKKTTSKTPTKGKAGGKDEPGKKTRKKRDANAPKKPMCAFFHY